MHRDRTGRCHKKNGQFTTCRIGRRKAHRAGPTPPNVKVFANGFGIWHVRVPRHAAAPLIAARRALREVLLEREGPHVRRSLWMKPVRTPMYDTESTIVYREGGALR